MLVCLCSSPARAADFGRISGIVANPQGMPLMGATVQIIGPMTRGLPGGGKVIEKIITDAHGRFTVERLLPGMYSLQVTSPTRLPILRSGILVAPGESVEQSIVLADILAPMHLQVPSGKVMNWGEDWKWVLRTSAATRPILRFQEEKTRSRSTKKSRKGSLRPSEGLIAMTPGSSRSQALADDPGVGSVIAYIRPLSENSDLLVAGSMGSGGVQSSSVATVLRRDFLKGDPQQLSLVIHQLNLADGMAFASGSKPGGQTNAQALSANYSQTRRVLRQLIVTAGFDFDYLNAGGDTMSARPYMKAEYELNRASSVVVRHGAARVDYGDSLLDRVGAITSFPRVTKQANQPRLERLIHSEVGYNRRISKDTRLEAAAYRDQFQNAAIWGFGDEKSLEGMAGNLLANAATNGVTLNAGDYSSSGVRAALIRKVGNGTEVSVIYAVGEALSAETFGENPRGPVRDLRAHLKVRQTQTVGGRLSTQVPGSRTYVTTSYLWIPQGRVNSVDPVGQANLQIQPYLGIQIRQPLPNLAFIPAKIEAMADFRNLLSQGYVPVGGSGEEGLVVTPAYRSFRGGVSFQF